MSGKFESSGTIVFSLLQQSSSDSDKFDAVVTIGELSGLKYRVVKT